MRFVMALCTAVNVGMWRSLATIQQASASTAASSRIAMMIVTLDVSNVLLMLDRFLEVHVGSVAASSVELRRAGGGT